MANKEHLKILKQGVEVWNKWREDYPGIWPDLSGADLERANLPGAKLNKTDLSKTNLSKANLPHANLRDANLRDAYLNEADLMYADFVDADLTQSFLYKSKLDGVKFTGANLRGARIIDTILRHANLVHTNLTRANFTDVTMVGADFDNANLRKASIFGSDIYNANFTNANLRGARFRYTTLNGTTLSNANLEKAEISYSVFANVDFSVALGLEQVRLQGPSTIGIDTLYRSGGKIPAEFLRGCGVPDEFITFADSLIGAQEAIQFYSCFISYSTKDDEFARRLYSRMREEKLRVWFAPEEMKGGRTLHEQIERAIQLHDRMLIILSEESMKSNWVINEIRNARRVELHENRRKLFPIGLTTFDRIKEWKRMDPDTGEDLALELRSYYIPDFSNWKDHDSFEREFQKLLRDLKIEEKRQAGI